jgi:hypothetical protein
MPVNKFLHKQLILLFFVIASNAINVSQGLNTPLVGAFKLLAEGGFSYMRKSAL